MWLTTPTSHEAKIPVHRGFFVERTLLHRKDNGCYHHHITNLFLANMLQSNLIVGCIIRCHSYTTFLLENIWKVSSVQYPGGIAMSTSAPSLSFFLCKSSVSQCLACRKAFHHAVQFLCYLSWASVLLQYLSSFVYMYLTLSLDRLCHVQYIKAHRSLFIYQAAITRDIVIVHAYFSNPLFVSPCCLYKSICDFLGAP